MKTTHLQKTETIPEQHAGMRIDQSLAEIFPDYSRATLQKWLKAGQILIDGQSPRAKDKVKGGEPVVLSVDLVDVNHHEAQALDQDLEIIYEDDDILVINKPTDLVVHPGAGNPDGTLLNALLNHAPQLSQLPRAGIVHRLDKDTTGLMIVAKTLAAQTHLVEQLQAREVKREYEAVVVGELISGRKIDLPISRHAKQRKKMSVAPDGYGKPSVTHVRIIERYPNYTRVRLQIETGRTHQIRVHLSHIGYPVLGDPVYGARLKLPKHASDEFIETLRAFKRQALHACQLSLKHPISGKMMQWKAPLPEDMKYLVMMLQDYKHSFQGSDDFEDDFDDGIETVWVYE